MIGKTAQFDLLSRVLDAASLRHAVIAHNLANVNTPNYHRLEVSFDAEVTHLSAGSAHGKPQVVESTDATPREDGNTVDMDLELATLNRNALLMSAATQILAMKMGQLRSAISGK